MGGAALDAFFGPGGYPFGFFPLLEGGAADFFGGPVFFDADGPALLFEAAEDVYFCFSIFFFSGDRGVVCFHRHCAALQIAGETSAEGGGVAARVSARSSTGRRAGGMARRLERPREAIFANAKCGSCATCAKVRLLWLWVVMVSWIWRSEKLWCSARQRKISAGSTPAHTHAINEASVWKVRGSKTKCLITHDDSSVLLASVRRRALPKSPCHPRHQNCDPSTDHSCASYRRIRSSGSDRPSTTASASTSTPRHPRLRTRMAWLKQSNIWHTCAPREHM